MDAKVTINYLDLGGKILDFTDAQGANNISEEYASQLFVNDGTDDKAIYLVGKDARDNLLGGKVGAEAVRAEEIWRNNYAALNSASLRLLDGEGARGYTSRALSGTEKGFGYPFSGERPAITVHGVGLTKLMFVFSLAYGEYATEMSIAATQAGKTPVERVYYNCRPMCIYKVPAGEDFVHDAVTEYKIELKNWSKPGVCAKVSSITAGYRRAYESRRIVNLNASIEDRSDPDKIEYGMSSQYGSVEILDENREFELLNEFELLQDNLEVQVEFVDKKEGFSIAAGCYRTRDWDIAANKRSVNVNLTDLLEKIKIIEHDAVNAGQLPYTVHNISPGEEILPDGSKKNISVDAKMIFEKLLAMGGIRCVDYYSVEMAADEMCLYYKDYVDTLYLKYVNNKNFYFEGGTIYDMIKKLLQAVKLRMYVTAIYDDGKMRPMICVYRDDRANEDDSD